MPMVVTDPKEVDNPVVMANAAFLAMTGYDAEEILGRNCRLLQGAGTDPADVAVIRRAVDQRVETTQELLNYRKDGSSFWNQVHISPIFDDAGELIYFFGSHRDLTASRDAAASLAASEERLRILQNEFAHLARANELGEMAAGIAHEINQPLTAISNYLYAGLRNALKSEGDAALANAELMMRLACDEALRAGQIVRNLRHFVGKGTGKREACEADQIVIAATEFAAFDARANGIEVTLNNGAGETLVDVDPVQLQQVLVNLIRNAVDSLVANMDGKQRLLTIETRINSDAQLIEFSVADTGAGISSEMMDKMFVPFASSKTSGMGIGLSISKRLIETHGGTISVESADGVGATFRFSLPILSSDQSPA